MEINLPELLAINRVICSLCDYGLSEVDLIASTETIDHVDVIMSSLALWSFSSSSDFLINILYYRARQVIIYTTR